MTGDSTLLPKFLSTVAAPLPVPHSSISSFVPKSSNGSGQQQTRVNGCSSIERVVYLAAESGTADELSLPDNWTQQRTPFGNNVLHIHVGKLFKIYNGLATENVSISFIRFVLCKTTESSLLLQTNGKGDTPLHLAARFGHTDAVQEFIEQAVLANQQGVLLNTANKRKDMALHDATRAGHGGIVKLLVEAAGENDLQHMPNHLGETPLFLAAERGFTESFCIIAGHTGLTALQHTGPCGQTPLHVSVMCGNKDIVDKILEIETSSSLIRIQNNQGQTPLHCCAAQNVRKHRIILTALLDRDDQYNSAAYIQDNEGRTPLHIATLNQNFKGVGMLIHSYPDCIEMVDNKGQNVVHFAAKLGCLNAFELFLRKVPKCDRLINEKDNDGNTPLHLLMATTPTLPIHRCFFQLPSWLKRQKNLDLTALNDKNLTAGDIIASNDSFRHLAAPRRTSRVLPRSRRINEDSQRVETMCNVDKKKSCLKKIEDRTSNLRKAGETRLVVAALIATVSFTAEFTVPGGFDQNPGENIGLAVLAKKAAFIAFLVSDTIAFTMSSIAIICYFSVANQNDLIRVEILSTLAYFLNSVSLGALMTAFVTGVYAVVSQSPGLAFTIIAISLFYFYFYLYLLFGSCWQVLAFMTRNNSIEYHS